MMSADGESGTRAGHIQYFRDYPANFGTVGNYVIIIIVHQPRPSDLHYILCLPCFNIVGNTQEGVVCENDPRNESIVKCQSSSMDRSLQILSIADCSRQFSPGQTEHQYCYLNNVTIDGHGTVDTCNSSFCTNLVIVVRDPDFSGTLNYSVIRDGKKMNIGNFTISGT